jgi:hypothetical protein
MTSTEPQYTPENDPTLNLRSDLWPTMTLGQLSRQHEIAIDKAALLATMVGSGSSPSIINLYSALQVALKDLSALIDNRSAQSNKGF